MTPRKTPLSDRLAELGAAVPVAQRQARDCEIAHRKVVANIRQLADVIAEAYADHAEERAAEASKQRAALEQGSLREAEERLEGARRAVARAEAEHGLYAAEHVDGVVAERLPHAVAAAQSVEVAVEQIANAPGAWNAVQADFAALLRLAGRDTGSLPRLPAALESLARHARRVVGVSVPPPAPGGHTMTPTAITPHTPTTRST